MTEMAKQHVIAILESAMLDETERTTRIRDLESAGHRIIGGGQTGRDAAGESTWEITDWRSGEMLSSGIGDDAYAATLAPRDRWVHIDGIEIGLTKPQTPGIPPSLAAALEDWIGSLSTPDQDVADWVGWDVATVRRYRAS